MSGSAHNRHCTNRRGRIGRDLFGGPTPAGMGCDAPQPTGGQLGFCRTHGAGTTDRSAPMIAPTVKTAVPLDPYVVRVVFADGEVRDADIEPLLDGPVFAALRDPAIFVPVQTSIPTSSTERPSPPPDPHRASAPRTSPEVETSVQVDRRSGDRAFACAMSSSAHTRHCANDGRALTSD